MNAPSVAAYTLQSPPQNVVRKKIFVSEKPVIAKVLIATKEEGLVFTKALPRYSQHFRYQYKRNGVYVSTRIFGDTKTIETRAETESECVWKVDLTENTFPDGRMYITVTLIAVDPSTPLTHIFSIVHEEEITEHHYTTKDMRNVCILLDPVRE
jgi:hypothetical protein